MASQLSEIHDFVQTTLARGSSFNSAVKDAVQTAAKKHERNNTFAYMRKSATLTIDVSAGRVIALPNSRIKEITLVRYLDDGATGSITTATATMTPRWITVPRIDPADEYNNATGLPRGYWLRGADTMVLNSVPEADFDLEVYFSEYSDWSQDDTYTNWLIEHCDDLLKFEALILLGALTSNPSMITFYTALREEALRGALMADFELSRTGRDMRMRYQGGI